MQLKLKRFDEGVWFDYPAGGRFKVRPATPKKYLEIREQSKKGKVVIRDGKREIVDDYDESQIVFRVFEWMLEDWQDVTVDGASTPDQIRESIFNDMDISNWVGDRSRELAEQQQAKFDGELKNFASSQDGCTQDKNQVYGVKSAEKPIEEVLKNPLASNASQGLTKQTSKHGKSTS